ncbi:response regulator [uncultured Thiodictyon sp.]|uniref:response regulator n=1 Tax=uncultured Thiodictyon sp. TaxID=1846217 RepID=UPI0025E7CBA8|nr:response regulator [uncultured Thiodictyon sp.]
MLEQTRFRVLIVDDSPTMRAVCSQSLTAAGMTCTAASNAEDGYRLLLAALDDGQPFDGLLLDWLMPSMNGWELLERIGDQRRLDPLAVMIFTEQPDDRAYQLASRRPNNDIQLKEDLTLLPYRMRKFLTTYSEVGGMGDWRARQLLRNREQVGGSILFVDDSPTVCAKYGDLLRNNGYAVLIANSMGEALEVAQHHKPQLAVVDFFMPGGNGDELCRALLADDRTRDITVVMHSQRKDVIEHALDAGAIDLIWKDDPINIFLMRIASIMRTLRANRQARDLDILFAATQALDIGVMSATGDGFKAFNATMDRFALECGGLQRFDPQGIHALPHRCEDRDGRRRAFNVQTVDGESGDRVVLVQDVTVTADQAEILEQARDRAVELANIKSQFLASMSHEIRTPLNGVLGMLELLKGTELTQEQGHYVDTGIASAEGLLGVIGDILDFSKIDAGRLELEHVAFNLPDLVEETMQMFAGKALSKGLEVICNVEPEVPTDVVGDPTRLRQVLINLIGNAIKFTQCGEVGLRVWLDEAASARPALGFAVCDTGMGVSPEAREHIFEAFRQADNTTTRRFGGTGLGLAISNQLVQMMGGTLELASTPGVGSTFSFTINLEASADPAAPPWRISDLSVLKGRSVLIVDDNATNRLYLQRLCRAWSMECTEAQDGPTAIRLIEECQATGRPFDLILLDRMMPGMDGFEVLKHLRADPQWRAVRVVLQTSMDEVGEGRKAREQGADEALVKPIRRTQLLETLSLLFGGGHADPAEVARTPTRIRLDGCRVLAVEDNHVNQIVLNGILQRAGCVIRIANNGQEALDTLAAESFESFDVVLMDCEMPVLDGLSATRMLRQREQAQGHRHQIVVALTAHAYAAERDRCLAAGMDDYLPKPIRAPDLLATLDRWWTRPQLKASGPGAVSPGPASATVPQVPPEVPWPPPIDPRAIKDLREAIGEIATVIEVALGDVPRRVADLRLGVERGDGEHIRTAAHTLAGSVGNLGGREMVRLARRLEALGTSGELGAAPELLVALETETGRFLLALAGLLKADTGVPPADGI